MAVTNDTGTYHATAAGDTIYSGLCKVTSIRWVEATTAGHEMILHDSGGFEKFKMEAAGANYTEESGVERIFDGVVLNALGSGSVYVELRPLSV